MSNKYVCFKKGISYKEKAEGYGKFLCHLHNPHKMELIQIFSIILYKTPQP